LDKPKQRGLKKGHEFKGNQYQEKELNNLNLNFLADESPEESKQSAKETAKLIGSD
jgi:hypothetical protein